jgi:hypothetical protein
MDKEIWTGRLVKQSNKDRNERRTGQIKGIRESMQATKIALAEKTMTLDSLERIIEKANSHYGSDLKKDFGQQQ